MEKTARSIQKRELIIVVIGSTLVVFKQVLSNRQVTLERVVFACTLGQVAFAGRLCAVVAISEHAT